MVELKGLETPKKMLDAIDEAIEDFKLQMNEMYPDDELARAETQAKIDTLEQYKELILLFFSQDEYNLSMIVWDRIENYTQEHLERLALKKLDKMFPKNKKESLQYRKACGEYEGVELINRMVNWCTGARLANIYGLLG